MLCREIVWQRWEADDRRAGPLWDGQKQNYKTSHNRSGNMFSLQTENGKKK